MMADYGLMRPGELVVGNDSHTISYGALNAGGTGIARACDIRFDPADMPFARGETGLPRMRGWIRPKGEEPDVLFAMLAGDILPPTVFNLGGDFGWAPTVQLTALLRGRPAPGWLRCSSVCRTVAGTWFDEDTTVVDSAGRIVCQARQLALAPLPGSGPLRE